MMSICILDKNHYIKYIYTQSEHKLCIFIDEAMCTYVNYERNIMVNGHVATQTRHKRNARHTSGTVHSAHSHDSQLNKN